MRNYIDEMNEQEVAQQETGLSLELKNLKTIDKAGIKDSVNTVVSAIQDGWADKKEAHALATKGKEYFTELEKNLRPLIEAEGISKDYTNSGVKYAEAMTGVKYDYSVCGDLTWNQLNTKKTAIEAEMKQREAFLKTVTKKTIAGDADTGEGWEVNPPVKSGKLGFKCEIV
jgi:hypothetical protein